MSRFNLAVAPLLAMLCFATATAQSADEHTRLGVQLTRELRAAEALEHFEAAVALDSTAFEALWNGSMNAVDLGEFEKDKKKQQALYRKGEQLARKAVALKPGDADARFHLARSLGMVALSVGVRDRVKFAREIREHCLEALRASPKHPGALHVLGVWNAEVMRLSGLERTLARTFLGAGFFSEASWDDAIRYLEQAAAAEPERLVHHLDLARVYRDRKLNDKARESYRRVIDGAAIYFNDAAYKQQAAAEIAKLK